MVYRRNHKLFFNLLTGYRKYTSQTVSGNDFRYVTKIIDVLKI
ncbi:hypothetical protein CLV98_11412 [Dyadobacter jejuensis]|uniref:Uncharacterized protein n=1 Tax=Dyadobacter jejuensis TaxID=1082580 RepID=A0A316AED5_9BACT|nr:hypothetical protein CLV98_11412 [Dyadobacter jejuensis]